MSSVAPLIAESWQRNRRRRIRLLLAATASVVGTVLIWWASGLGTTTAGSSAGALTVRASAVLVRSPYMGIATCHQAQASRPQDSTCYRIGLAVWLKRPAEAVRATSANGTLTLNHTDHRWIPMTSSVQRREFIGFFTPTGIVPAAYPRTNKATYRTAGTPDADIKLTIVNSQGRTLVTRLRVPVEPGWG